ILPRGNDRDLRDVPDEVRERIRFEYVDRMDDVIRLALLPGPESAEGGEAGKPERKKKREAGAATASDGGTAESDRSLPRAARGKKQTRSKQPRARKQRRKQA